MVDAQEIQAIVNRQRRCAPQAGPVSDRAPVDSLPLAGVVVPFDARAERGRVGGRALQIGQFRGRFLRAARSVVDRHHAGAAYRRDELHELCDRVVGRVADVIGDIEMVIVGIRPAWKTIQVEPGRRDHLLRLVGF